MLLRPVRRAWLHHVQRMLLVVYAVDERPSHWLDLGPKVVVLPCASMPWTSGRLVYVAMLCSNAKFRGSGLPFWPDARCGLKVVKRTLVFSAGFLGCVFQTLTLWVSDAQRRQEHGDNLPTWKSCDAAAGQQQITTYVAISLLIVGCLAAAQRFDQLAKTSYQHAHVQLGPLRSAQLSFLYLRRVVHAVKALLRPSPDLARTGTKPINPNSRATHGWMPCM